MSETRIVDAAAAAATTAADEPPGANPRIAIQEGMYPAGMALPESIMCQLCSAQTFCSSMKPAPSYIIIRTVLWEHTPRGALWGRPAVWRISVHGGVIYHGMLRYHIPSKHGDCHVYQGASSSVSSQFFRGAQTDLARGGHANQRMGIHRDRTGRTS